MENILKNITENTFEIVNKEFNRLSNNNTFTNIIFRQHPLVEEYENYKYDIIQDSKNELIRETWKESQIGKGKILNYIKNAINVKSNNLIDWRKIDDFKKLKPNYKTEKFLFDFFKSKIKDEIVFNNFVDIGFSYQLIAFLFFIKNSKKYMPISQVRFDKIFNSLNIDFKTSYNCSWENYITFNEIIKVFQKYLKKYYKEVSLLDAHSFLWIYGYQFDKQEKDNFGEEKNNSLEEIIKKEKSTKELENYVPKKIIDNVNLKDDFEGIDFIEKHKKQIEIGNLAEKIVLENEIEFLKSNNSNLYKKVRLVSYNLELGVDVLSFELDGTQKQIEVKAISNNGNKKSFIITENELSKSKLFPNYYIYCVTDLNSENPKILRIKNPNLEDTKKFMLQPLSYRVTFE